MYNEGPIIVNEEESEDAKLSGTLMELLRNKKHLKNIIIVLFLWGISSFNYFLINFQLKYIEGDIYINTMMNAVSEIAAYIISGLLYSIIGPRVAFFCSFLISCLGSIFYITYGTSAPSLVPLMVLGTKFGIAAAFNLVWLVNVIFPSQYASTTIGYFNAFARISSMFAP